LGVLPQARQRLNDVIDAVVLGAATPERASADGARDVKSLIENYNQSVSN
jgi:hypothetical protein